jgi:hypothetical protein
MKKGVTKDTDPLDLPKGGNADPLGRPVTRRGDGEGDIDATDTEEEEPKNSDADVPEQAKHVTPRKGPSLTVVLTLRLPLLMII